jgi:hypothetical protein
MQEKPILERINEKITRARELNLTPISLFLGPKESEEVSYLAASNTTKKGLELLKESVNMDIRTNVEGCSIDLFTKEEQAIHSARYLLEDLTGEDGIKDMAKITGLPEGVVSEAFKNIFFEKENIDDKPKKINPLQCDSLEGAMMAKEMGYCTHCFWLKELCNCSD